MKLTVFGASGGVGRKIVTMAKESGHEVRAVYREICNEVTDPSQLQPLWRGGFSIL